MGEWEQGSEKGRALRCAESFQRLADVFLQLPARQDELQREDLEEIYENVKLRVCASCGKRADCWGRDVQKTTRLSYLLLAAVAEEEQPEGADSAMAAKESFFRHCVKGHAFCEELRSGFCRARINLMWNNRMLENRAAVAEQLHETAQIIQEIACTIFESAEVDTLLERKVKGHLRMQNVRVQELRVARNAGGHPELILTASTPRGRCIPTRTVAEALSKVCGRTFVPERDSRLTLGREKSILHFVEDTRYYMLTGTARATCAGQAMSGDNFSVLTGSYGQVVLSISDGMGSGPLAGRESQTVIELLEQFLEAGFSAQTAVRMINSSMVLRRGMQRFSTLDICGVNLYSGQCEFLKIGAATTFIRRAGWVETVASTSLPIGVFREVDCERSVKRLEHGDMIVMVSDGVLDAFPPRDAEELMKHFLLQERTDNPAELAQLLMDRVLEFEQDMPGDDMTIVAGGFWKK